MRRALDTRHWALDEERGHHRSSPIGMTTRRCISVFCLLYARCDNLVVPGPQSRHPGPDPGSRFLFPGFIYGSRIIPPLNHSLIMWWARDDEVVAAQHHVSSPDLRLHLAVCTTSSHPLHYVIPDPQSRFPVPTISSSRARSGNGMTVIR